MFMVLQIMVGTAKLGGNRACLAVKDYVNMANDAQIATLVEPVER